MLAVLLVFAIASPQSPQPPRDTRVAGPTATDPTSAAGLIQLAKQQEEKGALADAEATLLKARGAFAANKDVLFALGAFYNRQGDFEKCIAALEDAAQLTPDDPQGFQLVATYYWEKAYKDRKLTPAEQYTYIMQGISATDHALALKPDYAEAMTYKNLLLRLRANAESDPALKQQLVEEADRLRNQAIQLIKARTAITGANSGVELGPPPPPPPPPPADYSGVAPVRVGGNIKPPTKTKDVRPVYPPDALAAGIAGVVIIETTVGPDGRVADAKILRSIPIFDQAALEAVRQWEFTPTLLNGVAVPVIMTVTVNFTTQ